jgi:uncharacterized repeat protein (TIGR03847 family)
MSQFEMSPSVFTADYVGKPGERTFYLQSQAGGAIHSFLVEKQQVAVLADKLRELLVLIDDEDTIRATAPARDPALELEQPVEPEWRVGTMGLAYEEDNDRVVVFMHPLGDEDDESAPAEEQEAEEDEGVRLLLRRDQVRSFALHALAVVAEGRPLCQLCGLPMDPSGHVCPASNGHRSMG